MSDNNKTWGILAEFDSPASLVKAAAELNKAGYQKFECHSPFPIHGIDEAAGEKRSKVSMIAGITAFIGGVSALILQWWTSSIDYPLVISGKPFFSYQAFFPVTFALAVLLAALGALLGMLGLINLKFHHPVFNSDNFKKVTDDGFFVSIEAKDKKFNFDETEKLILSLGGKNIELIPE